MPRIALRIACIFALAANVSGCAYRTPTPGETVYVTVAGKLTIAAMTQDSNTANVGNALDHGVSPDDINSGRLALAHCAEQSGGGRVERNWFVKLPAGETFVIGTQTSEFAEITPGTPKDRRGPLSQFVRKTPAPHASELHTLPYQSKLVACEAKTTPGTVRVELTSTSNSWWLKSYTAVQEWVRALPQAPLSNGQLYMASCAVGTDAWLEWYVQAAPGQQLAPGQVIKVRAGNAVSAGAGPVSHVLDTSVSGYATEQMFGQRSVRCIQ